MANNKIMVDLILPDGHSQEDGEVDIRWKPINFWIYSELFPEMISEAVDQWLSENKLEVGVEHELIFQHIVEHDGGGALMDEHFEIIWHERVTHFELSFD